MSASINEIEDFLNGALVSWLESCLPRPEILCGYKSLLDGSIIYTICLQIDPEPPHNLIKLDELDGVALSNGRSKNFDAIVRNLKSLYEEELGQTVLELPDCTILGNSPETKSGLEQMKLLLILLLGAAVQCPNKELFIGRIKELDVVTQHAIVELIKQVTDNQTLVLTQDSLEHLSPNKMYNHIIRIAKERDQYHSKWISSLANDSSDNVNSRTDGTSKMTPSNSSTSTSSSENNHLAVELADLKSKLRKIRQELEEKNEAFMEVKEELDHKVNQFEKLRNESQEWYAEARRAAAYRDEVDVLRERSERADRLEIEIQRFREKLSDAEFYKTRVEELREDNRLLLETKDMLEEQLQRSRKRSEHVMSLESEIIKYKQKLNDLALERDADKNKLQELLDENTQLQLNAKNLTTNLDIENSQSDYEEDSISGDNSLSEQLTNNAQSRALKLELENRRLTAALEALKESSFHESSNKILELEKDKKKISLKYDQLQDNCNRLIQQNQELENVFKNALEENKKLQDSLDASKQAADRQSQDRELEKSKIIDLEKHIESLNKEKQRIQTLSESIQRRANDLERTVDSKTKEIENSKNKMAELELIKKECYDLNTKLSSVEKENTNLSKEVLKFKEILETKDVLLDENASKLEIQVKEIQKLNKNIEDYEIINQKLVELEKKNQELQSQSKIDIETISTLQKDLISGTIATKKVKQNLEKLGFENDEIENIEINVENVVEKLVKNPETFKTVREIILNVGKEIATSDFCVLCHRKEIFTVEKEIEISSLSTIAKPKILSNIDLLITPSQTNKILKEHYDQLLNENNILNSTNETLQTENAKQKVDVSTLSSQITSLNTQHVALQLANSQLAVEKDVLVKKLESVKQQYDSLHKDQISLQCLHEQLNSEYDSINKEKEILKLTLRDIRLDNRDLKERNTVLEKLINDLKHEIEGSKEATVNLGILRAEHSKLKDDFRNLFTTNERLKDEYKNSHESYRNLRTENSRLKLQITELSGELNNRTDHSTSLEIELTKMTQKCDTLFQMNTNLDTDRRALMEHASQILSQYRDLLGHSLEDKQHYHDEEKSLTDRVNNLNRQKEKLEEKIMEYYRKVDNCSPKKKTFGSSFVKRVRKAGTDLMNKVPSRNRRSWIDDSRITQSNFTLGSESGGNDSDNSIEDPNSCLSDTVLIQKYSKLRQTLPRKPSLKENSKDSSMENGSGDGSSTLTRGTPVRNSLQTSTTRKNNSITNLDSSSEVTSPFNLGTAGSRRTVYLVDENAKINENKSGTKTPPTSLPTSQPNQMSPDAPTPTNENNITTDTNPTTPSTFLMYNRISTIIGGSSGNGENAVNQQINGNDKVNDSRKKNGNNGKGKESAVWYEYGCV